MSVSALASALAVHVAGLPRQKILIEELYTAAVAFDRSLATVPTARQEIYSALDELVAAGLVVLPRSAQYFDTRDAPALPKWVRRPPREPVVREARARRIWPAVLEAAGEIATRDDEIEVLEVVTSFLREGGSGRPSVPHRERSLELFDDEKRIDRLLSTRLFRSGALTLDLLRCHTVPIPFVSQWVSGAHDPRGTALLIAENHHTYVSLLEVTRAHAAVGGSARHVGYGTGGQFPSAVLSVPLLTPRPDRILYFGDVDMKGLQIPIAADTAATCAGLPSVAPALPLYELLFDLGRTRPGAPITRPVATEVAAWLGSLSARACDLMVGGQRLPQEAVGYELLTARADKLMGI